MSLESFLMMGITSCHCGCHEVESSMGKKPTTYSYLWVKAVTDNVFQGSTTKHFTFAWYGCSQCRISPTTVPWRIKTVRYLPGHLSKHPGGFGGQLGRGAALFQSMELGTWNILPVKEFEIIIFG
nr:hypothetical protein BgiMline_028416 [Biomphalaria glabrata]